MLPNPWKRDESGEIDFNACLNKVDLAIMFGKSHDVGGGNPRPERNGKDDIRRNRRGRSPAEIIDSLFGKKVRITEGSTIRKVTIFEAIVRQLYAQTLSGDHRALRALVHYSKFGNDRQKQDRSVIVQYQLSDGSIYVPADQAPVHD